MNNFLIKKDLNSKLWEKFKDKFWVTIDYGYNYFGVIDGQFVKFHTIGTVPNKKIIISLKEWYVFDYLNFPELFLFETEESFYTSDSREIKNFLKWFSEVSNFVLGNVMWKFFYRDRSLGANGYNITNKKSDLPEGLITVDYNTILKTFENEI